MNISKFERFCIKHRPIINLMFWIAFLLSLSISGKILSKAIIIIFSVVIYSALSLVQNKPNITAVKLYQDDLDPKSAVSLMEELLKIRQKDNLYEKQQIYDDLFRFYISLGDTEKVIDLCTEIKRKNKKLDKSYDLQLRLFLCTAYLNCGEKYLYDKEINQIQIQLNESKTAMCLLKEQFHEVKLLEESLYGGSDPRFEENVFDFLYKRQPNGKVRNKKPSNIQKISAYGLLFNFYTLTDNEGKATEYASKIAETGNEQFIIYRNAKEYLCMKVK